MNIEKALKEIFGRQMSLSEMNAALSNYVEKREVRRVLGYNKHKITRYYMDGNEPRVSVEYIDSSNPLYSYPKKIEKEYTPAGRLRAKKVFVGGSLKKIVKYDPPGSLFGKSEI